MHREGQENSKRLYSNYVEKIDNIAPRGIVSLVMILDQRCDGVDCVSFKLMHSRLPEVLAADNPPSHPISRCHTTALRE